MIFLILALPVFLLADAVTGSCHDSTLIHSETLFFVFVPLFFLIVVSFAKISNLNKKLKSEITKANEARDSIEEIANTVGDSIYVINMNGYITYANPKCIQTLGWSLNELKSTHSHVLMHHTRCDGSSYVIEDCLIMKSINDGLSYSSSDEVFWKKDGTKLYVSVNASPIIRDGVTVSVVVAFQDISDKKISDERAMKLLAEQAAFFDSTVVGMSLVDEGVINKANRMWNEILGYQDCELNGLSMAVLFGDKFAYYTFLEISSKKMSESYYENEHQFFDKHGKQKNVILSGAYIDKKDVTRGSVWSIVDITVQKELEAKLEAQVVDGKDKLEESRQAYELLFNSSPVCVGFADKNGRVLNANPAFCKALGYELHELLNVDISKLTHKDDIAREFILIDSLASSKIESFEMQKRMIRKDSSLIEIDMIVSAVRNPDMSVKFYFALMEDVTEKNLKDRAQKEQERIMIQQSRMAAMGEMISAIAHQWRQPLNSLGLMIQDLIVASACDELNEAYLDSFSVDSMKQINFMSKTIDNFREFFKTDKTTEIFSVADYIEEVASMFKPQLFACGISVEILSVTLPRINGLRHEFGQVVLNIINNAKDALVESKVTNPRIVIDVFDMEDAVSVKISDNAGGIHVDVIEKIFDPYFTTKEEGKGTGIGLYVSKIIIDSHMKGSLRASNGKYGAVFEIVLPKNI